MALYKYFKLISKLCKKCDKLELPDLKYSFSTKIPGDVVKINKIAKKHVHAASHAGTPLWGPYLKISSTEKAVVCSMHLARACRHFKEKMVSSCNWTMEKKEPSGLKLTTSNKLFVSLDAPC